MGLYWAIFGLPFYHFKRRLKISKFMLPIDFKEANKSLGCPEGSPEGCEPLAVNYNRGVIISKWQLEEAEAEALLANGKIWVHLFISEEPFIFVLNPSYPFLEDTPTESPRNDKKVIGSIVGRWRTDIGNEQTGVMYCFEFSPEGVKAIHEQNHIWVGLSFQPVISVGAKYPFEEPLEHLLAYKIQPKDKNA